MQQKPERRGLQALEAKTARNSADKARWMRQQLRHSMAGLLADTQPVRPCGRPRVADLRGEGHFHLVPELFLQTGGSTCFTLPHGPLALHAGEALLMPPRMLHAEATVGTAFSNIVVYADGTALTCHLATETSPGRPGIDHLESRQHPHAARIHDWLADAATLGSDAEDADARLQVRALLASACAGVLRVLDDAAPRTQPEPPLVARVRMWVNNQLGDHALTVTALAAQAGCTPEYLSHVFSQTTGGHLIAHINRQRMARAAHLLAETDMAGKEVAWACGFTTPSYFIQTFRQQFGATPQQWRAKRRAELGDTAPS
ncbi:helix-turn-helix transcriptional regulator [Rhodoferax sp.]|uniref:helix-turn-helix transcriptional regulator n=1 Tax=Rhodoferax sp. TaxID=50421 RepID=UPI0025DE2497|nr:helix-turn-helix transcriptional regulator [Rhodoferax sp.]